MIESRSFEALAERRIRSLATSQHNQRTTLMLSDHGDLVDCHLSNPYGDNINIDLGNDRSNLPDVSSWKYRPVFIQPVGETHCPRLNEI